MALAVSNLVHDMSLSHTEHSLDSQQVTQDLTRYIKKYVDKNPRSQEALHNASSALPGGTTRSVLSYDPFPLFFSGGRDCFLTSLDGHEYLDFVSEYTAGMFGHSNPDVKAAVQSVLDSGFTLGGPNAREGELAKLLVARFASMDAIRFCNSGTEANTMAIATALAFTGRKKILVFHGGYHGGTLAFGNDNPLILPHQFKLGTYNDIELTRQQIDDDIAIILVEPMQGAAGNHLADRPFLNFLREEATRIGAVLIFDEVVTSRLQYGGLQEHFELVPDMTTIGKHFGGGFSFGAFGGKQAIMDLYNPKSSQYLFHSGTWNNNLFSMTAGVAATKLLTREALERNNALGDILRDGMQKAISSVQPDLVKCSGFGSAIGVAFNGPDAAKWRDLFYFYLLDKGIYIGHRGFFALNLCHTQTSVDTVLRVVKAFCNECLPHTL